MKVKNFPDLELCKLIPDGLFEDTSFLISDTKEIVKRDSDCYDKVKVVTSTDGYIGQFYPCPLASESCNVFMKLMMSDDACFDADICTNADNALSELLCLLKVKNIPENYLFHR